jgi:hypothetical protein
LSQILSAEPLVPDVKQTTQALISLNKGINLNCNSRSSGSGIEVVEILGTGRRIT